MSKIVNANKKIEKIVDEKEKEEIEYFNVELTGEFNRTGTYLIPSNWTVEMLFEYGDVKESGDISSFVLTDLIEDNKEYYVPIKGEKTSDGNLININTASIPELTSLNGIGEVLAVNILEYREKNPFTKIEDIKNVKGIGNFVYEKIKDFITV